MSSSSSESEEEASVPFRVCADKRTGQGVCLHAWCPTMDLLVLATKSAIVVHRLNWQRLLTISLSSAQLAAVTALSWRPDGRILAVGHADGTVSMHEVENGELVYRLRPHTNAVSSLHWIQQHEGGGGGTGHSVGGSGGGTQSRPYDDEAPLFFPSISRLPGQEKSAASTMRSLLTTMQGSKDGSNEGSSGGDEGSEFGLPSFDIKAAPQSSASRAKKGPHGPLTVLVSADVSGHAHVSAFGVFPVGSLDLGPLVTSQAHGDNGDGGPAKVELVDARLSHDLCHLTAVVRTSGGAHHAAVLDCRHLRDRRHELSVLASSCLEVQALISHVEKTLGAMQRSWKRDGVGAQLHSKIAALGKLIRDYGEDDGDAQGDFVTLLLCGHASNALEQFLETTLSDTFLSRLERSVDNACTSLERQALDHVQGACEMLAFRLSFLQGLTKWQGRFDGLWVPEAVVGDLITVVLRLISSVDTLVSTIQSLRQRLTCFCQWLQDILAANKGEREGTAGAQGGYRLHKTPEVVAEILAFIKEDLVNDRVAVCLSSSSSPSLPPPPPVSSDSSSSAAAGSSTASGMVLFASDDVRDSDSGGCGGGERHEHQDTLLRPVSAGVNGIGGASHDASFPLAGLADALKQRWQSASAQPAVVISKLNRFIGHILLCEDGGDAAAEGKDDASGSASGLQTRRFALCSRPSAVTTKVCKQYMATVDLTTNASRSILQVIKFKVGSCGTVKASVAAVSLAVRDSSVLEDAVNFGGAPAASCLTGPFQIRDICIYTDDSVVISAVRKKAQGRLGWESVLICVPLAKLAYVEVPSSTTGARHPASGTAVVTSEVVQHVDVSSMDVGSFAMALDDVPDVKARRLPASVSAGAKMFVTRLRPALYILTLIVMFTLLKLAAPPPLPSLAPADGVCALCAPDASCISLSCSGERGLCALIAGSQQKRILLLDMEDEEEYRATDYSMDNENVVVDGGGNAVVDAMAMDEDVDSAQQQNVEAVEKLAAEMKMCESFVLGMLRARGSLALDVIHNNLKVSSTAVNVHTLVASVCGFEALSIVFFCFCS